MKIWEQKFSLQHNTKIIPKTLYRKSQHSRGTNDKNCAVFHTRPILKINAPLERQNIKRMKYHEDI